MPESHIISTILKNLQRGSIPLFAFLLLLMITPPLLAQSPDTALPGRYELQGVMEMAGELRLNADHRYQAAFTYGAADWVEAGRWAAEGTDVVLSQARFQNRNTNKLPLFLPSGTRFRAQDGKLTATGPGGQTVTFLDPTKTPSHRKTTGEPGEGRMRVRGTVLERDADVLVVKMQNECVTFAVSRIAPEVLQAAQVKREMDAEIAFSAIISGGSCPP